MNGEDIWREPVEDRKRRLAALLRLPHDGIAINEAFGGLAARVRSSTSMRVRSAVRALCQSGSAPRTELVDRHTG